MLPVQIYHQELAHPFTGAAKNTQTAPPDTAADREALQRGLKAFERGDYARAEEALKDGLSRDPFLSQARLVLGQIYLLRGLADRNPVDLQQARRLIEMTYKLNPDDVQTAMLHDLMSLTADDAP